MHLFTSRKDGQDAKNAKGQWTLTARHSCTRGYLFHAKTAKVQRSRKVISPRLRRREERKGAVDANSKTFVHSWLSSSRKDLKGAKIVEDILAKTAKTRRTPRSVGSGRDQLAVAVCSGRKIPFVHSWLFIASKHG